MNEEEIDALGNEAEAEANYKEKYEKIIEFHKYGKRLADLLYEKNQCYGNAVAVTGKEGIYVRMFDKFERVKNVSVSKNDETTDESIADTIMDIAGYAILWIMLHEKASVFFDEDGNMKLEGSWKDVAWANKLRIALYREAYEPQDDREEIILCQRCNNKAFDLHHKTCYLCDGGLKEIEVGGTTDVVLPQE